MASGIARGVSRRVAAGNGVAQSARASRDAVRGRHGRAGARRGTRGMKSERFAAGARRQLALVES
ncbi:hypothetical protein, partial [Burkholderia pseudomallei]